MANGDLLALQVPVSAPLPKATDTKTNMLLAPISVSDRMRHFPEEVYDLSAESHLVRFVSVLLGDAGAGQLRKRLLVQRLQSTLQGSHFFDLDRFYGPLFGLRRSPEEALDFDPYTQTATTEKWDDADSKDASFRSRIAQFAKALTYGATPTGMELISEALLCVDCEVYESYIQADASYQTYGELEDQYGVGSPGGTYAGMQGLTYGQLEGEGLARMSGDERRVFTVRPKRAITLSEAYDLRQVLNRIKPADCRFVIDASGIPLHDPIPISGAASDSEHWQILSLVATQSEDPKNPYQVVSADPVEQPRPPFSEYQGEAWSYNADMIGVSAFSEQAGLLRTVLPTQRITFPNGVSQDYPPQQAILPRRVVQAGRVVSDGILVTSPYSPTRGTPAIYEDRYLISNPGEQVSGLYADGIPVDDLNTLLKSQGSADPFQQNPDSRFWVTPERYMVDMTDDYLEVRLSGDREINYVTLEVSRYPHEVLVEVYDTVNANWVEVHRQQYLDSKPRVLPVSPESAQQNIHPQHAGANHWEKIGVRVPRVTGSRVRVRMRRVQGNPPVLLGRTISPGVRSPEIEVPYSLAVRSLDFGYRVTSRADFDFVDPAGDGVISTTQDVTGSRVEFVVREQSAANLLTEADAWCSEPQPVNYAVVNLYLDTRGDGSGTVIDRFFLDPTHVGPHFSIYYSNDPQVTDGTDEFYAARTWTPIPRDYALQKGFVHLPPTRARYWKFEFTNLVAVPYETFLPISRTVRLFPASLVNDALGNYGQTDSPVPSEMVPAISAVTQSRYADALNILGAFGPTVPENEYSATEALYFPNLDHQQRFSDQSWVFNFTPWQQGTQAPRFSQVGVHTYDTVEVVSTSKIAFFVGLKSIEAFRTDWEQDEDTEVYFDTLDDFYNLTPGFTWNFDPGYLHSVSPGTLVEVTSRVFASKHNVTAIQYATQQSDPVQLVPNDDFRDPAMATYTWDDPDYFLKVGDAQLIYSPGDHSVLTLRYVVPPPLALDRTGGLVQDVVQPVFSERSREVPDEQAAAETIGGLSTPLVALSPEGRVYAAVRFTLDTDLTSPLLLQIVRDDGTVLASRSLTGSRGETLEEYVSYDIEEAEVPVRARLVQMGKSDDAWRLDTISIFEDAILWDFSVNGGTDWYRAIGIRNNDTGVLTFPNAGNQLRFRARTYRDNQWISAFKIRPWYVGTKNARPTGTHRGPNLSYYDHDVPIGDDPMFTSWKKPLPYGWYSASKRYPLLPVEGIPNVTEYARFYGRPTEDTLTTADSTTSWVLHGRSVAERMDYFYPLSEVAVRVLSLYRIGPDDSSVADSADAQPLIGISKPIVNGLVRPVFSERRPTE